MNRENFQDQIQIHEGLDVKFSKLSVTDFPPSPGQGALGIVCRADDVETISVNTGPADLDVRSTAFTEGGNTWALSTSNGSNQVKWESSPDGSSWTTFAVIDTLYTLAGNVAQGNSQDMYLRITMPTITDSYLQYGTTVTVVASVP